MYEQPSGREFPNEEIITSVDEFEIGVQYERFISYDDGVTSTQLFTVNGPVDDEASAKLLVTLHFPKWPSITKEMTLDEIGLNGPVTDGETSRYVRGLLSPDER